MSLDKLFKKIRRIEITTNRLVEELLAGAYLSAFKGNGIEFEEVREYVPGDDIRTIDWNVTARTQHPHVKTFREERELTVILLVDISASTRFGTKSDLILELAALIAFSAIRNQDKVGLILFSDRVEKYIPPKKGQRHVLRLIRDLIEQKPKGKGTSIKAALEFLGKVQRRMSVAFLISDFQTPLNYKHEMRLLSKRHDLNLFHLSDPMESSLPKVPLMTLCDLETGETLLVDSTDPKSRDSYKKQEKKKRADLKKLSHKLGAGWLEVRTDQRYIPSLIHFFHWRQRGRK